MDNQEISSTVAPVTETKPVEDQATTAGEALEKTLYVYYFSDPDSSDYTKHCVPIYTTVELKELPWHWHKDKPDESLTDPIWSTTQRAWIENAPVTQTRLVAKLQHDQNSLTDKINGLEEQAKGLNANTLQIGALQKMQATTNAMVGQVSAQLSSLGVTMKDLVQVVNGLKEKATDAKSVEDTAKTETAEANSSEGGAQHD